MTDKVELITVFTICAPNSTYMISIPSSSLKATTIPKIPYCDELKQWILVPSGIKRFIACALLECGRLGHVEDYTKHPITAGGLTGSIMVLQSTQVVINKPNEIIGTLVYALCNVYPSTTSGRLCVIPFDE
jgi:hypothetical protein